MSLWSCSAVPNKLIQVLGVTFLCVAYFNSRIIAEPISVFLHISFLTGQALVKKFLSICNCTVEVAKLTHSFFEIVYEDLIVFVKDATEKFTYAIALLKNCYIFLESGVQRASAFGWDLVNIVFEVLKTVSSLIGFLNFIFISIKDAIRIFGSSVWLFITFIPEAIVYSCDSLRSFIKNSANDLLNIFYILKDRIVHDAQKFYQSLTEVPVDSVYGLIIGLTFIVILFFKSKDISLLLLNTLMKLYHCAVSLGNYLWTGRFLEHKTERVNKEEYEDDDRLCVVCQVQLREVIIFPCKHLCLCQDCDTKIMNMNQTCPVCRAFMTGTLKVYV